MWSPILRKDIRRRIRARSDPSTVNSQSRYDLYLIFYVNFDQLIPMIFPRNPQGTIRAIQAGSPALHSRPQGLHAESRRTGIGSDSRQAALSAWRANRRQSLHPKQLE